jgi:hypothetical protein
MRVHLRFPYDTNLHFFDMLIKNDFSLFFPPRRMRVHLRGVVIGVGALLAVVVVVSLFNAMDEPSSTRQGRSRHAYMDEEDEDEAGPAPRSRKNSAPRARNRHGV